MTSPNQAWHGRCLVSLLQPAPREHGDRNMKIKNLALILLGALFAFSTLTGCPADPDDDDSAGGDDDSAM